MNFNIKLRLMVLGSAVGLMGAAIVLILWSSQRQTEELRTQLRNVDSESFEIAAHFKDSLRELNNIRMRYAIGHDPAVWNQFLQASADLAQWIDRQEPMMVTPVEKDSLRQVKLAYADYLRLAQKTAAASIGQSDSLAAFARVRSESQHLFDLGETLLDRAHYESRNRLLADANQRLAQLRWLMLGLLGLLFLFGIALAALAYRDLIAPLRVKLVENRLLLERQEKLVALGMLAAGVAHEIRNPLTAIKAALFIQQKRFKPDSLEYADSEVVQREILRLERIVKDFLQFARPTEPELAAMPADLPLQEVQLFFAPELAKAGITLVLEPSPRRRIRADAGQIKQVLINLVRNAMDSIDQGGTITLRVRSDRKWLAQVERAVVILEVADTGKGIPPEIQKRLFDPFFTTKDSGTGLGLSIAARIVHKHGGALQYQSQVNRGTIFGIVLPEATE